MKIKATILALMIAPLLVAGCATMQPQPPPPGCENAILYQTSFVPLGPVVVRSGLSTLAVLAPTTRPAILQAAKWAEGAFNQGNLVGGIGYLIAVLVTQSDDPLTRLLVMNARITLDALSLYPGIQNAVLTDCDRNILVSLAQNVKRDVESLSGSRFRR